MVEIDVSKLHGTAVYLKRLQPQHVPALKELARDARLWLYTKSLVVDDTFHIQFDKYMAAALDPRHTGSQYSFVIYDAQTNAIIGSTRYYKIEPAHKRLSIGYTWYVPGVWGRVHNKECKLLLLQYAFENMGYQRVEFEVAHQNIRSQKAVEKIGGIKEGLLRKHGLHADGTLRHTFVFSIIDDEWPAAKAALQRLVQEGTNKNE